MIIGIDGNEANVQEKVGVHQYAYEILWSFYRQNVKSSNAVKLQDIKNSSLKFIIYLKNPPFSDLPEENAFWKYKIIPGKRFWVLKNLTPLLSKEKLLDVFWSPNHYVPPVMSIPKVCTIHDLGYLEFSEQFKKFDFWQLKYWSAISIIISKYIICPSLSTEKDIVRHYAFASHKTRIINHGYDKERFNMNIPKYLVRQVKDKYRITGQYILFLSTLKPSKNIEGLLTAFSQVRKNSPKITLVIAGKKGWLYDSVFEKVKDLKLTESVIFTDYVEENDKPALIKGSLCFVLPSFWEGFGMDVLNAMACGIPVVVSHTASLPEVAGDAGVYVDPKSTESLVEGLEKILNLDKDGYDKLVKLGLEQAQKYSWQKSSRETLEILKLASKNGEKSRIVAKTGENYV